MEKAQYAIPSRTGKWGQNSIVKIINNEVYLGKIRWRREPVKRVIKDGMLAKKRVLNDDYSCMMADTKQLLPRSSGIVQRQRRQSVIILQSIKNGSCGIRLRDFCGVKNAGHL